MARSLRQMQNSENIPGYTEDDIFRPPPQSVVEADKAAEEMIPLDENKPQLDNLYGYLMQVWDSNRTFKERHSIQEQMVSNLRARKNEYDPDKLEKIKAVGGSAIYAGITNSKCQHAEAWLHDILSSSDKAWALDPTPDPDPSAEVERVTDELVQQEILRVQEEQGQEITPEQIDALIEEVEGLVRETLEMEYKTRAKKMEDQIFDQMLEGNWDDAFDDFITDLVTLKAAILKGPIARKSHRAQWIRANDGTPERVIQPTHKLCMERVSPFDIYPSNGSVCTDEGSLVERQRLSRASLVALKNEPGYDSDAIDRVLRDFSATRGDLYFDASDDGRRTAEDKDQVSTQTFRDDVEALEFWLPVQGRLLIDRGVTNDFNGDKIEELNEYEINAIIANDELIYVMFNTDPYKKRPYSKAVWEKIPGSFWGKGIPELMPDIQQVCNAALRSLVRNMGLASGPQAIVDTNQLVPGENLSHMHPLKIWQVDGSRAGNSSRKAIEFFNVNAQANELITVYNSFAEQADDRTGVPSYKFGSDDVPGSGRTSSGLSMLLSSSSKGLKRVILNLDRAVLRPIITRYFDWNMQYNEDDDIKGDVVIRPTGAVAVMAKEQLADRRMSFLQSITNDVDMELIDPEGRANILRETVKSLEMDPDQIVKDPETVREEQQGKQRAQEEAAQQEQQLAIQTAQLELEEKKADIQIKQMELQKTQTELQIKMAELEIERERLKLERDKAEIAAIVSTTQAAKNTADTLATATQRDELDDEIDDAGVKGLNEATGQTTVGGSSEA